MGSTRWWRWGLASIVAAAIVPGCADEGSGEGAGDKLRRRWRDAGVDAAVDAGRGGAVDAGVDAAPDVAPDAGVSLLLDAGQDAGLDAGLDAGQGAGLDAGQGAGLDAGQDLGLDAGQDAGLGAGQDAGLDAGQDAGLDAGQDPGLDAGASSALDGGGAGGSRAHLYVAAHPDDDLLFMNPDIEDAYLAGLAVRVVYVTSGDAGRSADYWLAREEGVRDAYAAMANVAGSWSCSTRTYAGKTAVSCMLTTEPALSLLFLRLPDQGVAPLWATDSGPPFWVSPVSRQRTVDGVNDYTRAELIEVLSAVIAETLPERVGTLDSTLAYGDDHQDHIASAMFALEAIHSAGGVQQVRSYRGYSMYQTWAAIPTPMPRNLTTAQHDEKVRLVRAYGSGVSPGDLYDEWCWRRYSTRSVLGGPSALTGADGRCIDVSGTDVVATACSGSASQRWTVQSSGYVIGAGGLCLTSGPTGASMIVASCTGSREQLWTLLDNGQLRGAGATCLTLGGDLVTLAPAICESQQVGTQLTVSSTQRWAH